MKKNLHRSITRVFAVQALYSLVSFDSNKNEISNYFLKDKSFRLQLDFDLNLEKKNIDKSFFLKILDTHEKKKEYIDKLIKDNLDKKWDIKRIPAVLHSILIAAISEMIVFPKISLGIVTSEYIIITESFFSKKESAFVNAILEKIYLIINIQEQ